jgi:polyhydroxyalkanoate synthase
VRHNPGVSLDVVPTPDSRAAAGATAWDKLGHGHLAGVRPMPAAVIDEGPHRTVYRYHPSGGEEPEGRPVLLVPPLAAPARCFDLLREHGGPRRAEVRHAA